MELIGLSNDLPEFQIGLMMKAESIPWAITCCYVILVELFTYAIMIVCGWKIRSYIDDTIKTTRQSRRNIEVNRQLNYILALQTSLPIVELSLSLICMVVSIFFKSCFATRAS
ncbi:serpentine type 7TM GPCR chemoreceptor str domain-containing protein [Ditylenchus destructor]|nr:serpentine type 7TM GPCR chemoreceptor str domain-containing protein [Ditylenchus destructor]